MTASGLSLDGCFHLLGFFEKFTDRRSRPHLSCVSSVCSLNIVISMPLG
jgi:hypothetical protein